MAHSGKVLWLLSPSCGCPDKAFVSLNLVSQAVKGSTVSSEEHVLLSHENDVKLLIYHNPEKGAPGDCALQALTSAAGKRSQYSSRGKPAKLSWSLEKEAEGHPRGQPRISLQVSGLGQRPVTQSQDLDAVCRLLQMRLSVPKLCLDKLASPCSFVLVGRDWWHLEPK